MTAPGQPKPGGAPGEKTSPYKLDHTLLSPTARAQDMIAHYLGDHLEAVANPVDIAFAAVYAIEAGGLAIVDPARKPPGGA